MIDADDILPSPESSPRKTYTKPGAKSASKTSAKPAAKPAAKAAAAKGGVSNQLQQLHNLVTWQSSCIFCIVLLAICCYKIYSLNSQLETEHKQLVRCAAKHKTTPWVPLRS